LKKPDYQFENLKMGNLKMGWRVVLTAKYAKVGAKLAKV